MLSFPSLGIIASWATIVLCQLQLWRWWKRGKLQRWFAARKRVLEIARMRKGYTGEFPVIANIPVEGE